MDKLADLGAGAHTLVLGNERGERKEQEDANEVARESTVRAGHRPFLPRPVPVERDDDGASPRTDDGGQCRQTHKPLGPLRRNSVRREWKITGEGTMT